MILSPVPRLGFLDNNGRPLVGGLLFTYVAGTTNKIATYTDESGGATNTNPIVLDFRGECNCWLDPELTYKFVLAPRDDTDPPTRPIWSVDNIQPGITLADLTRQIIGRILYPETPEEAAAGVTILNYYYPPLYVDRYVNNTAPGVTSTTIGFQSAIDVAKEGGGIVRWGATGIYLVDGPLDCTVSGGQNAFGYILRGQSGTTDATKIQIIFRHTGHCFDLTGATRLTIEDLDCGTDDSVYPDCLLFLARNSTGGSAGWHRFFQIRCRGNFSDSVIYNYASEDNAYIALDLQNSATGPTKVITHTGTNIRGLTSTFATVTTGDRSNIDHEYLGGSFINLSGDAASDIWEFERVEQVKIFAPWAYCAGASSDGRSIFYVNTINGTSDNCKLYAVQGERGISTQLQTYGIYFGDTVSTPTGWVIDGCYLPSRTRAIFAHANVTLDGFYIRGITEEVSRGVDVAGTLQNSTCQIGGLILSIGTSTRNFLAGDTGNWTITTRNADNWQETGSANRTFTPDVSGLTSGGVLTVSNVSMAYHGPLVTLTFTLSDTVSIMCANNTNITGLPAAATGRSALVSVWGSVNGFIGGGAIIGTNLKMPAVNVLTEDVTVTASYFVA
jgi:hypothetical protein